MGVTAEQTPKLSPSEHPSSTAQPLPIRAERLAAKLLERAGEMTSTRQQRRQQAMHRLVGTPAGPTLAVLMADRCCRTTDPRRIADTASHLLRTLDVPRAFALHERTGLHLLPWARHLAPSLIADALRQRIRSQASGMLLDAAPARLAAHLQARHQQGTLVNVNWLGEALVGEREAQRRVDGYRELAQRPEVDALSVKISSICSQLSLVGFESTVARLAQRLGAIYDAAGKDTLVYLDMEAYDEVDLTTEAMLRALSAEGRKQVRAGIVVQAYLPDAHALLRRLLGFAHARAQADGTPLQLRFVKGANLAAERVHASLMGWALPVYPDKASVDASYRRLLDAAMRPEHADAVRIGVGSHNVFDLAYALCLAQDRGVERSVHVELLEGMADALRQVLSSLGVPTLVYAPVVEADSFHSAIAYLVRRLDENATDENFLKRAFAMRPHDGAFELERTRFRAALERMQSLSEQPRRQGHPYADRTAPVPPGVPQFENEPNTDFSTAPNRRWLQALVERQRALPEALLQSVVDGQRRGGREVRGRDPSRPEHTPYRVRLADDATLEHALETARRDRSGWGRRPLAERVQIVRRVAGALRAVRGELLGWMLADGGKAVVESDPEVSEAIDFAEYYAHSATLLTEETGRTLAPRGVVLVASPWNFPLAIPTGGTLAALVAGNRVLLKPAPQTPWVASRMAELCWQAGVPEDALQLLLCDDGQAARLSADPRVDAVVLTGATATARAILRARPEVRLSAETGGKNALIVSAVSDREEAIRDAVRSAFGHAGQKCSAASLLICEAEVYDDPKFRDTLADAAASLRVGSAYEPDSVVTPLIEAPSPTLQRGLSRLEPGEQWLLTPRPAPDNPWLFSPGVRWDVLPGSFTHMHELFGPVLSVMRARDLAHAVELAQQPGYGLTAGLHSLDEREHAYFAQHMRAGNLYINRNITGAIVRRQPFGGMALSCFGPGAKAGGPDYVLSLGRLGEPCAGEPERDYADWWEHAFAHPRDPSGVLGEANVLRYLPCVDLLIRVQGDATQQDLERSCHAAAITGCDTTLSLSPDAAGKLRPEACGHPYRVEPEGAWLERTPRPARVRLLGRASPALLRWAAEHDVHVATDPVSACGRVELLHYLREQSLSIRYHRHGHLGAQALRRDLPIAAEDAP